MIDWTNVCTCNCGYHKHKYSKQYHQRWHGDLWGQDKTGETQTEIIGILMLQMLESFCS